MFLLPFPSPTPFPQSSKGSLFSLNQHSWAHFWTASNHHLPINHKWIPPWAVKTSHFWLYSCSIKLLIIYSQRKCNVFMSTKICMKYSKIENFIKLIIVLELNHYHCPSLNVFPLYFRVSCSGIIEIPQDLGVFAIEIHNWYIF